MTQKTCRLATASASGCGGCCSRPTKTTSWKSGSNLPLTARLSTCRERMEQLPPSRLLKHNHVLPQTIWSNISGFIVSSSSTLYMSRMFILVLPHKENKLHPIYRTIKSQDNFTERSQYERLFPAFVLHYKQKKLTLQSNKQRDY